MSWLDRLRAKTTSTPPPFPAERGELPHTLPLGLRLNGRVAFDTLVFRAHPDKFSVQLPEGHQGMPCYGHIDLGGGHALHRFYFDEDGYLQVSTAGDAIEGIKAFVFVDTVNPPNQSEFQRFISSHEHLGAPTIDYAGQRWHRDFSADAPSRAPAVVYDEVLYRHSPPRRDDDLTHYAMLYRREIPELQRDEFLLVTGEDYGPNEFCVTYAIGLDLTTADLDIT